MRFEELLPSEIRIPRTDEEKLAHISRFVAHISGENAAEIIVNEVHETEAPENPSAQSVAAA